MVMVWILGVLVLLTGLFLVVLANPIVWRASPRYTDIPVNTDRLRADVATLCASQPARNCYHPKSLNQAADYIKNEWAKAGITALEDQRYTASNLEFRNIIATFGPAEAERIVVGAHYDVCDDQPGADDNASGVAGILEIGRLLHSLSPALKYRVDLVAYSLEEPPFFRSHFMGSYIHAKSLRAAGVKVRLAIVLEMIGYFSEQNNSQNFPLSLLSLIYPTTGNFIAVVGNFSNWWQARCVKNYMQTACHLGVYSINAPAAIPGIDLSDHRSYWRCGYPAVMVTDTSFFRNPNYHLPSDTPETLDFDKMAQVVRATYATVMHLASKY